MKNIVQNTSLSKKFLKLSSIVVVLSSLIFLPFFVTPVKAAGINNQINFQGKLVNSNGTNVTDNTYTVVFSLYNVSSGGSAIWTESDSVTTTGGVFQVALGAVTAFPGNVDFNNPNIYLGIRVGADAEMTPRIRFSAVPYAFNAAALDGVVATQSAMGFTMQGGTSTQSTLAFTTSGGALTFQPGVAEGLTLQSNGANGLSLDAGGGAAVSIGTSNATSVAFGKSSNNTAFTFNNGSGGFTVNGTGSVTFSALNAANGLVYTSGTNGILSQIAPSGGSQCLQSNAGNTALAWTSCSGLGTNLWQVNNGALSPANVTNDLLLGATATTSAKIALEFVAGGTPVASISAQTGAATPGISMSGSGALQSLNMNSLTIGGATTGAIIFDSGSNTEQFNDNNINLTGSAPVITSTNALQLNSGANTLTLNQGGSGSVQFFSASNSISSTGNLVLAGTTGITLNGAGADISFTGAATSTITTAAGQDFDLMPGTGGQVGISTTTPLASFDVHGNSGTTAVASVSGATSFAGLVVNNSGSGDLLTASSAGSTKFTIKNSGSVVFTGNDVTISASGSGAVNNGSGAVVNVLGDEGSLVPNAGFEAFNNLGGFADGWVTSATSSATIARDTTTEAKGTASVKITTTGSNQFTAFYSACMPLALTNAAGAALGSYNLNYYARSNSTTILPTVRAYVDGYTSQANCNQNNGAKPSNPVNTTALSANTNWNQISGSSVVAFTGSPVSLTWGRVHFYIVNAVTGAQVNIDGVRLIEDAATNGLDYAEDYPADPNDIPRPGQVVSLVASDSAALVMPSHLYMDQSVLGVISTNPGQVLNDGSMSNPVPVALAGRVPVNVSTVNGPVHVGDYLTASTIPGVAVKATGKGQVIGTAMEDDTDPNTRDITQVTMFIKNTYYNGGTESATGGLSLLSAVANPSVLLNLLQQVQTASASALPSLTSDNVNSGLSYLASVLSAATSSSAQISSVSGSHMTTLPDGTATVSGLTINGSATVSAGLHVAGNALFEGILHVADTLFANNLIANGVADFFGTVVFHSGVTFNTAPVFDSDTAGFAVIKKGSDHVAVTFTNAYDHTPIVNASITLNPITPTPSETLAEQQEREAQVESVALSNIHYLITDRTTRGFTILLQQPAPVDISFSWVALAVNSPMLFQSNGQNIQLPTQSKEVTPTPMDTIIPTSIPVSPVVSPTDEGLPTPTPGG